MALRYYSNAPATTLSVGCTAVDTEISVSSTAGLPSNYPYTLILDRGTASEEVVDVTAGAGTTLTVTRGADSTTAFAHSLGADVEHGISARDVREANAHVNASTGVHGVSGSVVGTSGTQTLTNKTISLGSNTVTMTTAQLNAALSDNDVATLAGAETLTNKTLTSPVINTPTITGLNLEAVTITDPIISNPSYTDVGYTAFALKASSSAKVANAVLAVDTDFNLGVAANATYVIEVSLQMALDAGGAVVQLTYPAGAEFSGSGVATSGSGSAGTAFGLREQATPAEIYERLAASGDGSEDEVYIKYTGLLVTSGTSGQLQIQWAQETSNAARTIMFQGSYITIHRLA